MAESDTMAIFTATSAEHLDDASYMAPAIDTRGAANGHFVLDFDDTFDENIVFSAVMPTRYSGRGITLVLHMAATTAVANDFVMAAAFEKISDFDIDSSPSFATPDQFVTITAVANAGTVITGNITFADGSQMDSVTAGDAYRLRVHRDSDNTYGTDNMAGDAELLSIEMKEN